MSEDVLTELETMDESGMLLLDLRALPAGTTLTIAITIGGEKPEVLAPPPSPTEAPKRYMQRNSS